MINYFGNKIILRSIICIVLIINISCKNSSPKKDKIASKEGMVFIPGGNFEMGGDNEEARSDEFPKHQVTVSSFWMDITEVTNAEFQKFVDETGYITTAERKIDWDEIKKAVENVSIPVMVNGDINNLNDVETAMTLSGAHGVMIGRGSQGRPWIIGQAGDLLSRKRIRKIPTINQRRDIMLAHLEDMLVCYGSNGMRLARKHIAWYAHGLPGSAALRDVANNTHNSSIVFKAVDRFFEKQCEAA